VNGLAEAAFFYLIDLKGLFFLCVDIVLPTLNHLSYKTMCKKIQRFATKKIAFEKPTVCNKHCIFQIRLQKNHGLPPRNVFTFYKNLVS